MELALPGHPYPPPQSIRVAPFPSDFRTLYPAPPGTILQEWPPIQATYLGEYLRGVSCRTIVLESHYIDRDYIEDVAILYARSLRWCPNSCQRLHFFSTEFDETQWRALVENVSDHAAAQTWLQRGYLGFSVVRPLPGSPIGRTVLVTFPSEAAAQRTRIFGCIRKYDVHLGGFDLTVRGLAFQQQDQGVSACATIALWSAMHSTAHIENLPVPTPAVITESASRYALSSGRALPSEGLFLPQLCEAARAAGLDPLIIQSASTEDRWHLFTYIRSGFAPVITLRPFEGSDDHAVCGVGMKLGGIRPQTDPSLHFTDASSAVEAIYIHDDRLGPYASADLYPLTTDDGEIATAVRIRWPGQEVEEEHAFLLALVVPLPHKIRLTAVRMREVGLQIAEFAGTILFPELGGITLGCRYAKAVDYRREAVQYGLSSAGVYAIACESAWSRYIGIIEISGPSGPLFDVVLDATETAANPAMLAWIRRGNPQTTDFERVRQLADYFEVRYLD